MGKIQKLEEEVYRKIAAGEVIERPASVVKELVENSIDAGADIIEIELMGAGKNLITVADNGEGFSPEDIELAFKRHSTSKFKNLSDFDSLLTLGFRGEALPSILQVSKIELQTSDNKEGRGIRHKFIEGKTQSVENIPSKKGTRIEVWELFYNFPVRKKFLKSDRSELNKIIALVEQIAIVYHGISFSLKNNGRSIFYYDKTKEFKERIYQVFGKDFLESTIYINESFEKYSVKGFISKISTGYPVKKYQYFYVNSRPVREGTLIASLNNTFSRYLEKGRYPAGILNFSIPAYEIDVNIHPMKLEIKFKNTRDIYDFLRNSINRALSGSAEINLNQDFPGTWNRENEYSLNHKNHDVNKDMQPAGALFPQELLSKEEDFFILGQYQKSYIIIEKKQKLYIIDQHNAHERINYDKLQGAFLKEGIKTVSPLFPLVVELSASEISCLDEEMKQLLGKMGFDIREMSGNTVDIKGFPWFIKENRVKEIIISLLHLEYKEGDLAKQVIADIACKNSIKINHFLYPEEMKEIVKDLFNSTNCHYCPHQRPIFIEMSLDDVEKKLKRK